MKIGDEVTVCLKGTETPLRICKVVKITGETVCLSDGRKYGANFTLREVTERDRDILEEKALRREFARLNLNALSVGQLREMLKIAKGPE